MPEHNKISHLKFNFKVLSEINTKYEEKINSAYIDILSS